MLSLTIRHRFRFGAAGIGDGISTVGGGVSMAGFKGGGVALTTLGSGKMVASHTDILLARHAIFPPQRTSAGTSG